MDCNEKSDREIMKSIIAMLFSFAVMAEQVANRSCLVRCYMMWILRRAEAAALSCVGLDAASQSWALHRNSRADALNLAETLREIAHWLEDELREDDLFARWFVRHEARLSRFTSPFEGGGRTEGPGGGDRPSPRPRGDLASVLAVISHTFASYACRVLPPP